MPVCGRSYRHKTGTSRIITPGSYQGNPDTLFSLQVRESTTSLTFGLHTKEPEVVFEPMSPVQERERLTPKRNLSRVQGPPRQEGSARLFPTFLQDDRRVLTFPSAFKFLYFLIAWNFSLRISHPIPLQWSHTVTPFSDVIA